MRQPTSEISGLLLDIALLLDASETDEIEDKPYLPVAEKTYLVGCWGSLFMVSIYSSPKIVQVFWATGISG